MATTSTMATARQALLDTVDTGGLSGKVYYAWPGPRVHKQWFEGAWLGQVPPGSWSQQFPNSKAGRMQRQESYDIELLVWVARPDLTSDPSDAKTVIERCVELYGVAESAIADDVRINDDLQWSLPTDLELMHMPLVNGWGALIVAMIHTEARLT